MNKTECYISLDIETDGPCPGINNLLTIGAAAFDSNGQQIDTIYVRLYPLPDLKSNPQTMEWWRTQPEEIYQEAFYSKPRLPAYDAIIKFDSWLGQFSELRVVPVAWPAAFDHPFINYYGFRFLNKYLIGFACLDLRSYVQGLLRKRGHYEMKESEVNKIFGEVDKTGLRSHVSVDDAIGQGRLFFHLRDHKLASAKLLVS